MNLKTRSFHASNMGSFSPTYLADQDGYITIHDSPRYKKASEAQLAEWRKSRAWVIKAAAIVELAEREIQRWRDGQ